MKNNELYGEQNIGCRSGDNTLDTPWYSTKNTAQHPLLSHPNNLPNPIHHLIPSMYDAKPASTAGSVEAIASNSLQISWHPTLSCGFFFSFSSHSKCPFTIYVITCLYRCINRFLLILHHYEYSHLEIYTNTSETLQIQDECLVHQSRSL